MVSTKGLDVLATISRVTLLAGPFHRLISGLLQAGFKDRFRAELAD